MPSDSMRRAVLHALGLWWASDRHAMCAGMGYPRECPSTRGYRGGYRGGDAEADADELADIVRAVYLAVDGLPSDQQLCAGVLAKAEATGAAVWRSPRLPTDPVLILELEHATIAAVAAALCGAVEKV